MGFLMTRTDIESYIHQKQKQIHQLESILQTTKKELVGAKRALLSYINSDTAIAGRKEETLVCDDMKNPLIQQQFHDMLGDDSCNDNWITLDNNCKSDIRTEITKLHCQVKKFKPNQFQQLDRHWITDVIKSIPELHSTLPIFRDILERPLLPNTTHVDKTQSLKKLCTENYSNHVLDVFLNVLNQNRRRILEFAFLGTNKEVQPVFLFAVQYNNTKREKIVLFAIMDIINFLDTLEFQISPRKTGIILGSQGILSLQRKGGDGGKKTSNHLQFKIIISKLLVHVPNTQFLL
jgi:hypothetical protein